jgi:RimJ/RimL family protein N-acetyltransferase
METKRLVLRTFNERDGEWLYELDNDPEVMRYINGGIHTPRSFILNKVMPLFQEYESGQTGIGFWALSEKNADEPIGWCCLRRRNGQIDTASLGYRLAKRAWGYGYATEASEELVRVAFEKLELQALIATTYEENRGSRRVLEKLGFRVSREFQVDLTEQATAYFESTDPWPGVDLEYELKRDHWKAVT